MNVCWSETSPLCSRSPEINLCSYPRQGTKSSHLPSLPVIDLLLFLLYTIIVCDVLYILFVCYVAPTTSTARRHLDRLQLVKRAHNGQLNGMNKKKSLTIDNLWKRLKAEARHLKAMNARHRLITLAMMESRLHARSLERERTLTRSSKTRLDDTKEDESITMAQWAARIVAEHDPRRK
ncbi:uncharacterized protein LOC129924469 [Biomphalaria glabrata]|uniref:Uncharacterized protein LOC129924469 n=1 Tax=Biomphalaria glabrata TaxID=6526 RepID=A0A9W2ZJ17_BIOGL|nr:uncharacterized protein LOC129924469 [Biomphalaria glabrata]